MDGFTAIAIATLLCAGALFTQRLFPKYGRYLFSALVVAIDLRYVVWRIGATIPTDVSEIQELWAIIFLVMEMLCVLGMILNTIFMAKSKNRSAEADAGENSALSNAPVDVLIPTYNESELILERTLLCAMAINHADLRVWLLDDGSRPWAEALARRTGAYYLSRFKGKHAKAGNINDGLKRILAGEGRTPQFVLVLDADFVPRRKILKRVLGLFMAPDIGIVQTPQHFFNHDPVQSNLLISTDWPDEQRYFFNVLMPCKDAWGAAFCCGTSAVFRVSALLAIGGLATETVTEDMLTSFKMSEAGYKTIFLNEALSMGLAPEGLSEFVTQRARWCLGAIQQISTRWSFFGSAKLNLVQRISFFDGVLYWGVNYLFKLMVITSPMIYWWTGASVINASIQDIVAFLGPYIVANTIFVAAVSNFYILPVISDVSSLLCSPEIIFTVFSGLLHPSGRLFKVTTKGVSANEVTFHWGRLSFFLLIAAATFVGMCINGSLFSQPAGADGYVLNIFWSLFDIFILLIAGAICVELPRRRVHDRFTIDEEAVVIFKNGARNGCIVQDISASGALLKIADRKNLDQSGNLLMKNGLVIPFRMGRENSTGFGLTFVLDEQLRRQLIVELYAGSYHNDIERVKIANIIRSVLVRILK